MGHNSIFGNFRIAWENFRVHFNEWGNKRREQREANNKKAIASNYKKVAVAKKISDNERLKKQDLEQRKKEFLSLIEKEELRVSNSVNLTDDTEKKTIAAIPVKKITEEEKQKLLELRSKIYQLKNLVLDKVESLQSTSSLSVDIDYMDGLDFEHYIAELLNNRGFHAEVTKGSGDLGVDVIATNYAGKYAIQVKRYNQPVSRRAVSDAVAGKSYYDCDTAMVITNNYFTNDAVKLAHATGCLLVDRDKLTEWISDYTGESKSYEQLLADEIEKLQQSSYFWGDEVVFETSRELIQEFNIRLEGEHYEKYYVEEVHIPQDYIQQVSKPNDSLGQTFDDYILPSSEFLTPPPPRIEQKDEELLEMGQKISDAMNSFGTGGRILHICQGPVVTIYEFQPNPDVSASSILALSNRLRNSLNIYSLRIDRIPGKEFIDIEILNQQRETIYLREVIESKKFWGSDSLLTIALGKTINGLNFIIDLAKLPHLFVAGATNRQRTASLDVIINSIFYKAKPDEVKFVMIDSTRKELGIYADIPHLATPIIIESKRALISLEWTVSEMEHRYKDLETWGGININRYNLEVKRRCYQGLFDDNGETYKTLPYIVVVINEFADLVLHSRKDFENLILQLSQKGYNIGIHLVLATQQPSKELSKIINKTGNLSKIISHIPAPFDARFLIDQNMSNSLMTQDEMIFFPPATSQIIRVHGAFVDEKEIAKIVEHIKAQGNPEYDTTITKSEEEMDDSGELPGRRDVLFIDALRTVVNSKSASTSLLQRHLRIGYGRAAAILDAMVHEGYIGEMDGSKRARPILQKAYDDLQEAEEGREL